MGYFISSKATHVEKCESLLKNPSKATDMENVQNSI
jgi:hypothetical protein